MNNQMVMPYPIEGSADIQTTQILSIRDNPHRRSSKPTPPSTVPPPKRRNPTWSAPQHPPGTMAPTTDRRNVATHFVGIPLIVASIWLLLARTPAFTVLDTPAGRACGPPRWPWSLPAPAPGPGPGHGRLLCRDACPGLAVQVHRAAQLATGLRGGVFMVGWVFQFVGHAWEAHSEAFFDDLRGLLVGPLFVLARGAVWAGRRPVMPR